MRTHEMAQRNDLWSLVEADRRRDRAVRAAATGAWVSTFGVLALFAVVIGMDVWHTIRMAGMGLSTRQDVLWSLVPLLAVVGTISLCAAIVSTVGVFLRARGASLADIQVRLAALESALVLDDERSS